MIFWGSLLYLRLKFSFKKLISIHNNVPYCDFYYDVKSNSEFALQVHSLFAATCRVPLTLGAIIKWNPDFNINLIWEFCLVGAFLFHSQISNGKQGHSWDDFHNSLSGLVNNSSFIASSPFRQNSSELQNSRFNPVQSHFMVAPLVKTSGKMWEVLKEMDCRAHQKAGRSAFWETGVL